jgi:hypothetical protein
VAAAGWGKGDVFQLGDILPKAVGIIANPASGRDIRRLVAHGSVFDNQEKIHIIRRVRAWWTLKKPLR